MPPDAVVRYRPPVNAMDGEPQFQNPDYAVTIKVRNGRFLKALRDAGHPTIASFCKKHGLPQSKVGSYVTMILSPFDRHGEPTPGIQDIADRLGTTVDALFPPRFLMKCLSQTAKAEVAMTEDQISMLLHQAPRTPEDVMAIGQAGEALSSTIATLASQRERRVLIATHGLGDKEPITESALADEWGLSRTRVNQMGRNALEKMKRPSRRARLLDAAEALGVGIFKVRVTPISDGPSEDERVDREQPEVQRIVHRKQRYQRPPPAPPKPPETPPLIKLLRIPPARREANHKLALAHYLESLFAYRGAGYMRPSDPEAAARLDAMDPTTVAMAKYDWLMENLETLFRHYPPKPDLSLQPWETLDP
jgi:hypothetical protein